MGTRPSARLISLGALLIAAGSAACGAAPHPPATVAAAPLATAPLPTTPLPTAEASTAGRPAATGWLDPVFVAPQAELRGDASAQLLALQTPLAERATVGLIESFYRCVVEEDIDGITALAMPDAVIVSRIRGGVGSVVEQWRGRFRSLSYDALRTQRLYRASDIETYSYDDLDGSSLGRPTRPAEMRPGDRLVRVRMAVVRVGGDRVFGDELVFVLRAFHGDGTYRIRAIVEEFQPQ